MTHAASQTSSIAVLLVEHDPSDVERMRETLRGDKVVYGTLAVVADGVEAMAFLRREPPYAGAPRPDLILLNLELPRKDAREVLRELKADPVLRAIHVVLVAGSEADRRIASTLLPPADCCVTKPLRMEQLATIVASIEDLWFTIVRVPAGALRDAGPDT